MVEAVRTGSKGRYEARPERVNKNECVVERGHGTGVGNLDYTFSMCQLPEIFDLLRQRVLHRYCFRICGPVLSVCEQRAVQIPVA